MMKEKSVFVCSRCGSTTIKWMGRCPECGEFGTMQEERAAPSSISSQHRIPRLSTHTHPVPLMGQEATGEVYCPTGIPEFDRVLGGGSVKGSVVLIGGEPGIGKSTLLLQACYHMARQGQKVLLVSGEESPAQVQMRARRLGTLTENLLLYCETDVEVILESVRKVLPHVLVVDSIQTLFVPEISSPPGGVSQVRECALRLQAMAKEMNITTFLVGHVTKDGSLAGPRVLEHLVDTVLYFEGERYDSLRVLRSTKNRFGSVSEVGIFEMSDSGLREVSDPSTLFFRNRSQGISGVSPVLTMEGKRPLLVEVQALVTPTNLPVPKRVASGLDRQRFNLDLAVLEKRAGISFSEKDVFVGVAGGLYISEPALDLGVCLAVASSKLDQALPAGWAVFGEVSLAGEIRPVSQMETRIREIKRLGFSAALLPEHDDFGSLEDGFQLIGVSTLVEALDKCGLRRR